MEKIITEIENLSVEAKAVEFLSDKGTDVDGAVKATVDKLKECMHSDETIRALSAPQIGLNERIFCIRFADVIKTFINPIVTKKSGSIVALETSESMPGKEIVIRRPTEITVIYYTDEFKYEENKFLGVAASTVDQMTNYLDGIIPSDLGLVFDVEEDGHITDEDLVELVPILDQYIKIKLDAYKKEIDADEELSKGFKLAKFSEDVINGRTKIVESDGEAEAKAKAQKSAKQSVTQYAKTVEAVKRAEYTNYVRQVSKKRSKRK